MIKSHGSVWSLDDYGGGEALDKPSWDKNDPSFTSSVKGLIAVRIFKIQFLDFCIFL